MNFYFDCIKSFIKKYFFLSFIFILSLVSLSLSLYNTYSLKKSYQETLELSKETIVSKDENTSEENSNSTLENTSQKEEYYIDIKGYVKKPGVYKVSPDSIVNDCLKLAGGLLKNADTTTINLSKTVSPAMVIYIPKKNEVIKTTTNTTITETKEIPNDAAISDNQTSPKEENSSLKVNLNTASKEELITLSGIGDAKALDIIEYRTTNGPFKSIEEIKNISGIGDALFAKIKDNITI